MGIFEKALIRDEEILQLIPQRAPIVMVDAFYGIEAGISYSGLTVKDNNIFCQEGFLQEPGIIEHIAQSAAVRVGYIFTQNNQKIPLGFIGSVEKLKIDLLPPVGSELHTQIEIVQEIFDITLIKAELRIADTLVAACNMKIFLNKE